MFQVFQTGLVPPSLPSLMITTKIWSYATDTVSQDEQLSKTPQEQPHYWVKCVHMLF